MINLTRLSGLNGRLQSPMLTNKSIKGWSTGNYEITLTNFPRPKKFYPSCKFFFGRRGTAKSLSMVFMAWGLSNAFDQYMGPAKWCHICKYAHRPVRIAANFACKFADIQDPYLVDKLQAYPMWAHDLVVLIDEIATYCPSARAMSRTTLELGTWLQQIRKRRIEIMMATQFPQDITRTVLRQVDYFMEPEPIAEGRAVKLFFYDLWGQYTGNYGMMKWPPTREDSFTEKFLPRTYRVWGQYDTEEIFAPIWAASRDSIIDEGGWEFGDDVLQTAPASQSVLIPAGMDDDDDLDAYMRTLVNRNSGNLNVGDAYSDVQNRFKDELDWRNLSAMKDYLESRGWMMETVGGISYAKPPEEV
jgi:hypothetical protein